MKPLNFPLLCCLMLLTGLPGPVVGQQPNRCLTPAVRSLWLQTYQRHPMPRIRSNSPQLVAVTLHLVRSSDGADGLELSKALDAFCKLNADFAPTGIQFFILMVRTIKEDRYYRHYDVETGAEMMARNNVSGTVNVYFTEVAVTDVACGYNLIITQGDSFGMTLANSCTSSFSPNWTHEMGHYFSLPHTFHGWESISHDYLRSAPATVDGVDVELADGSNCQQAGDGFCDTPADYLNQRWSCAADGSSLVTQHDPDSIPFRSDGSLYMSYAADNCQQRFSDEQIAAMQHYLLQRRADHIYQDLPYRPIEPNSIRLNTPVSPVFTDTYDQVEFSWEKTPNASRYLLEISLLPNFGLVRFRYPTTETSIVVDELLGSRTYYWRVRAYNDRYTCPEYSNVRVLSTGTTTDVGSIKPLRAARVYPNPAPAGQDLRLQLLFQKQQKIDVALLQINGQSLYERSLIAQPGDQIITVPTAECPAGLYLLRISSQDAVHTQRVIIHR